VEELVASLVRGPFLVSFFLESEPDSEDIRFVDENDFFRLCLFRLLLGSSSVDELESSESSCRFLVSVDFAFFESELDLSFGGFG